MSQQQNQPAVSESSPHQAGSEAHVKPFSIRKYALACRQRNILNSWPFPDKYLHLCLNHHGLTDLLPPFDELQTCQSLKSFSDLMMMQSQSQDDISEQVEFRKTQVPQNHHLAEADQHDCSVSITYDVAAQDTLLSHRSSINHHVHETSPPPTTALTKEPLVLKDHKRRVRRRGRRCKKRLMTDILATAPRCTLEEIIRMSKFFYAETAIEGWHQQLEPIQNVSNLSEMKGEAARECHDHEVVAASNIGMNGKGTLLLEFELNGCSLNRNCGA